MVRKTIQLGDEVKDTITGFKGIAIAITHWIAGCDRINIQPKGMNKDGQTFDVQSFDEPLVEIIKKKKVKEASHSTGGPRPTVLSKKTIK